MNPSTSPTRRTFLRFASLAALCLAGDRSFAATSAKPDGRFLYVAVPGIRNYLEFGGHGVLVFDIDNGHKFVRRIPAKGLKKADGTPSNVKGVVANATTRRLWISIAACPLRNRCVSSSNIRSSMVGVALIPVGPSDVIHSIPRRASGVSRVSFVG